MIPAGGSNHEMLLEDPTDLKKPKSTHKTAAQADSDTVLTA
jgi:acetolactate synthase-1/2/3 large subunit